MRRVRRYHKLHGPLAPLADSLLELGSDSAQLSNEYFLHLGVQVTRIRRWLFSISSSYAESIDPILSWTGSDGTRTGTVRRIPVFKFGIVAPTA
jgi:hypothetical protein